MGRQFNRFRIPLPGRQKAFCQSICPEGIQQLATQQFTVVCNRIAIYTGIAAQQRILRFDEITAIEDPQLDLAAQLGGDAFL